jgi:SAM-dependent methyltransferase
VLAANRRKLLDTLDDRSLVLDVGGWGKPFERADWVIDLMPHETRGLYGYEDADRSKERFTADTWVQADICSHEPWPFADDHFDFVVCSHTLEDVRDPLRVCEEMSRVAKAGYLEVPSRLDEQTFGVEGWWVGRTHHRWFVDIADRHVEFTMKVHEIHGRKAWHFPNEFLTTLAPEDRVEWLFWEGALTVSERILFTEDETDAYLGDLVRAQGFGGPRRRTARQLVRAVQRRLPLSR